MNLCCSLQWLKCPIVSSTLKGNIIFTDAKTAACLYVACKQQNCYRSTQEIAAIYAVDKRELTNAIRRLLSHVNLVAVKTPSTELIDRYCFHLGLTREQRKRAYKIASEIDAQWEKKEKKEKTKIIPETVAGVSIYLAAASERGMYGKAICASNLNFGTNGNDHLFLLLKYRLDYGWKICKRTRGTAQ